MRKLGFDTMPTGIHTSLHLVPTSSFLNFHPMLASLAMMRANLNPKAWELPLVLCQTARLMLLHAINIITRTLCSYNRCSETPQLGPLTWYPRQPVSTHRQRQHQRQQLRNTLHPCVRLKLDKIRRMCKPRPEPELMWG